MHFSFQREKKYYFAMSRNVSYNVKIKYKFPKNFRLYLNTLQLDSIDQFDTLRRCFTVKIFSYNIT